MALGYAPIGFAVGALSRGAGMSPLNTLLMSLLVYAGSSQLIATQLLVLEASPVSVIATTFVVNLRHLLMASALAPHLGRFRKSQLALFSFQLTDEAFAMHSTQFAEGEPSRTETFTINMALHAAWLLGAGAAAVWGTSAEGLARCGLDYAPAAMFIALLALLIKDALQLAVALVGGLLAVVLARAGGGAWSVLVATLVGATLGLWGERWIKRRSSLPSSA